MNRFEHKILLIERKESVWEFYFILTFVVIYLTSILLLLAKVIPTDFNWYIYLGIPSFSIGTFYYIETVHKGFKSNNKNQIIFKTDKIIKCIKNELQEISINEFKEIFFFYNGIDQGPIFIQRNWLFSSIINPERGDGNILSFTYKNNNKKEVFEIYLKSERDAQFLRNVIHSYKDTIEVNVRTNK